MARIWQNGFEENNATTIIWTGIDGTPTVSTAVVRSGTYAGHIGSLGSTVIQAFRFNYASANSTGPLYFRQYINFQIFPGAENRIIRCSNSTGSFTIYITADNTGVLRLYDEVGVIGSPSFVLNTNQWYRLEFYMDATGGANTHKIHAYINGTEFAGSDIRNLTSGVVSIRWGGNLNSEANTVGDWYFDDLAINDSTGSFQKGLPGSGKIINLLPNATGDVNTFATQTGGTAGAGNNFTRVDEVTPDDATSFNGSNTLNQEDLFKCVASGINELDTVNVVGIYARFRNSVADATTAIKIEAEKISGGTKSQSSAIVLNSTTWQMNTAAVIPRSPALTLYQDPNSINWKKSTLDTMQIGYLLSTGGTNRIDVTTIWASVDYTPTFTTFMNNYQFVKADSGISVTEKIR